MFQRRQWRCFASLRFLFVILPNLNTHHRWPPTLNERLLLPASNSLSSTTCSYNTHFWTLYNMVLCFLCACSRLPRFWMVALPYGIGAGTLACWGTVLVQNVHPLGVSEVLEQYSVHLKILFCPLLSSLTFVCMFRQLLGGWDSQALYQLLSWVF